MLAKVFLSMWALVFISYGLYCLASPGVLLDAGVQATSVTGTIELQAMYGGLQTALGVLCLLGVLRESYQQTALMALLFIFAGLAVVRVSLGLRLGDSSDYTVYASIFEASSLLFLCWHLLLRPQAAAEQAS